MSRKALNGDNRCSVVATTDSFLALPAITVLDLDRRFDPKWLPERPQVRYCTGFLRVVHFQVDLSRCDR